MSNFLDSLISHWKCDEGLATTTLQDSHGTHDCGQVGSDPTVETGLLNGARGFPGVTTTYQQVIATEDTEIDVRLATMPSFAFACWYKITTNQAWHFLGSQSAGAGDRGWLLQYDNAGTQMRIGVYDDATEALTVVTHAMANTTGVWHYIYCGFDAAAQELVISVDGAAATRTGYTAGIKQSTPGPNFAIGGTITGGNNAFGHLDEISFWRTIHSDADIAALYNSGTPTDIADWTASSSESSAGQSSAQLSAGRTPLVARHLPVTSHLHATFIDKPATVVPAAITVVSRQIKD